MAAPIITLMATAANVADLKASQTRWRCACGESGPWETDPAVIEPAVRRHADSHEWNAFVASLAMHIETVGAFV